MILELFYGEVTAAKVLKKKCVLPDAWEKIRSEVRRNTNEHTPERKAYQ